MALSHSPSIVTDGLVLYLDAANRKSYPGTGTGWFDLSGRNNTGILTNSPTFSNANGGSFTFDDVDDYVQINADPSLQITNEVTVTSVFKANELFGNAVRLIDTNGPTTSVSGSMIALKVGTSSGSDISWFITDGTSYYEVRKTVDVITSTTIPYIVTARWRKSDGSANVFVNGIEPSYAGTTTFTGTPGILSNPIMIAYLQGYGIYGDQVVYSTSIYNRYLSFEEIQQNFNALRGRFGI
jgi:hypothetical protein